MNEPRWNGSTVRFFDILVYICEGVDQAAQVHYKTKIVRCSNVLINGNGKFTNNILLRMAITNNVNCYV